MPDPINPPFAGKPPAEPRSDLAAALVIICVALIFPAAWKFTPGVNLVAVIILLAVILLVLGKTIVRQWLGVLVNERNVTSLARFQLVGWTIVVLAAYFTYAVTRMRLGQAAVPPITDALDIGIDTNLWTLLGISTTSLVGSSLILGTKKEKDPPADVIARTADNTKEDPSDVDANRQGALYANATKADAKFTDIFEGDELGNATHVDLAKVQMFLFTVITLFAYVILVARDLRSGRLELLAQLPVLPNGIVALLGISHAGYLASKTVDHTPPK